MDLEAEARRRGRELRILVTRLRYLGDVILTTPAVAALKVRYPGAQIHYLAERSYAEILRENPSLAGIISLSRGARSALETIAALRAKRFIAAVDLFYNPRSALLLSAAGIPVRIGGSRRMRRRLYTGTFTVPEGVRSAVMHHLSAMETFDVEPADALPRVYLSREERESGRGLIERSIGAESSSGLVVAMHPGGTWPSKRWSTASFAKLARLVRERLGAKVLVIAGPGEEDIAEAVRERAENSARVLPRAALRTVASVLASCDAIVANDGGIMHLGVALGVPTVGIFGPTEPDIWFPYEGKGPYALVTRAVPCAPCHKHLCDRPECLEGIEPREALARLEGVLAWKR